MTAAVNEVKVMIKSAQEPTGITIEPVNVQLVFEALIRVQTPEADPF
jgi:hypothetical protein